MFVSSRSGDITKLNTIAIVNTTNESLSSKGVLSERIHRAAGPELLHECRSQLLGMNIVSEINNYYSIVKSSFLESSFPKTPLANIWAIPYNTTLFFGRISITLRAAIKILNYQVNTLVSRWGIKQLVISFGSIFFNSQGKSSAPTLNNSPDYL